jgi:hypothetical protein
MKRVRQGQLELGKGAIDMSTHVSNGNESQARTSAMWPTPARPTAGTDEALVATIVREVLQAIRGAGGQTGRGQDAVLPVMPAELPTFTDFARSLTELQESSPEVRDALRRSLATTARLALVHGEQAVPSAADFVGMIDAPHIDSKGGTVVRTFWWGFHVQVSHEDLQVFLTTAGAINTIVQTIGGAFPGPAQAFITIVALFINASLALLRALDRGYGVYISMSWFAPGAFVATSV